MRNLLFVISLVFCLSTAFGAGNYRIVKLARDANNASKRRNTSSSTDDFKDYQQRFILSTGMLQALLNLKTTSTTTAAPTLTGTITGTLTGTSPGTTATGTVIGTGTGTATGTGTGTGTVTGTGTGTGGGTGTGTGTGTVTGTAARYPFFRSARPVTVSKNVSKGRKNHVKQQQVRNSVGANSRYQRRHQKQQQQQRPKLRRRHTTAVKGMRKNQIYYKQK